MSLNSNFESQNFGPGFGFPGFAGFNTGFGGGLGLEALLIFALLGRGGRGGLFGGDGCGTPDLDASGIAAKTVELMNSSNLGSQIENAKAAILAEFTQSNAFTVAGFRGIEAQLNAISVESVKAQFESRLAALQSTNEIKSSIEALSTKSDAQFAATLTAINADGDKTRALITTNEINNLRDQLAVERRGRDNREIEISISNNNQQSQNQFQAQLQAQQDFWRNQFAIVNDQIAKQNQGIINLGTMVGNSQAASNTNIK